MKEKIQAIISERVYGYLDAPVGGIDFATEGVVYLMCYREVRAFVHGNGAFSHPGEVVEFLKDAYPQHTILHAIEQYKNEQK